MHRAGIVITAVALGACAGPAQRVDRLAMAHGFTRHVLQGTQWQHVAYSHITSRAPERLHIYLEGDGSPWVGSRSVARDPTPRRPLMLALMAADPTPSVYLGRPCYFGLHQQPDCGPRLWTSHRYSADVVASMAAALRRLPVSWPDIRSIHWLGHSGGGTLAMLLAQEFAGTESVLTVAGNLDPQAWTRHHGYTPLHGSLNPARLELAATVREIHVIGDRDRVVPVELWLDVLAGRPHARRIRFPGFDHLCCWQDVWPEVLELLP